METARTFHGLAWRVTQCFFHSVLWVKASHETSSESRGGEGTPPLMGGAAKNLWLLLIHQEQVLTTHGIKDQGVTQLLKGSAFQVQSTGQALGRSSVLGCEQSPVLMKTSKLENPKLMVPHGAMESTVSCPHFADEHSSVWNIQVVPPGS